jgi:hypothetical protein
MANTVFPLGREGYLLGEIDFDTAVFKVLLVRGYTYDATDKFVSDLSGATVAATSAALAGKTGTQGTADANDVTFTAVAANANNHVLILIQSSAVTGGADVATTAQRLVSYYDTGTLLPVVPNGGDITVQWDSGTNRIFTL